jgi:hypothetical protein
VRISDSAIYYDGEIALKMGNGAIEYSKVVGNGSSCRVRSIFFASRFHGSWFWSQQYKEVGAGKVLSFAFY